MLFVDIVDFTSYAERADPEQARSLQQTYFATVRRIVHQYGGVVEKYIGDAAMALFGAPVATDNDALRCVRAGLELQRNLARQPAGPQPPLSFRVGIATGEALVDLSATRDGGQAFVTGDVVNTASRLQGFAPPGGVVVDESTWSATRHEMEYADQPPVTLRGRSAVSRIWLAVQVRPHRDPRGAELTPMVDREHERGLLVNALHRMVTERTSQLVTVFGPAGVGKSRLLRELARHAGSLPGPPITWLVGQCPPFGENVTWAALSDIVKTWVGVPEVDDPAALRERLRSRLGQLADPHAIRLAEALGPLIGVPGERLTPGETEAAWRRFLLALATTGPTVLVFEDMHWADQAMLAFVEQLGASARGVPLLVVATARPELRERNPAWTGTISGAMSISVPPMHDTDIDTLYSLLLGQATLPSSSRTPLIEFADGNPLYAQEYARMLLDGGLLDAVGPTPASTSTVARRCPAPCRRSSPTGSTCWTRPTGRCSRPPPWWAWCSGPRRWRWRWGGRWSGWSVRWTACNVATWCTSRARRRCPASPSTGSGTSWCATSATSGCPGPSGCCATNAPPTGWHSSPTAGSTTWPRCWPTIAGRHTRSPGPSGWTPPPTPRRRGPRCTGRPAGRTSCTRWTPPPRWSAGRWPWTSGRTRRWSCSTPSWRSIGTGTPSWWPGARTP